MCLFDTGSDTIVTLPLTDQLQREVGFKYTSSLMLILLKSLKLDENITEPCSNVVQAVIEIMSYSS
jgi:hypothetical protein